MGDSQQTNSRFHKPLFVVMAALGAILMVKPGHDGDSFLGQNSGPSSDGQKHTVVLKPHPTKLATLPAFIPVEEKKELRIPPTLRTEPQPLKTPVNKATINPVEQGTVATPALRKQETVVTSPENRATASASFTAPAKGEEKTATLTKTAPNSSLKARTTLASGFQGLVGIEKVYEHVTDMPGYCSVDLKNGQVCLNEDYVSAQIHKSYFILTKAAQVNEAQAKIIIDTAPSNADLTKAGIIIVQSDKLDEMGNLLLSVVYSDKGITSTWYDPANGVPTQRHIAHKDKPFIEEQYVALIGKWVPAKTPEAGKNTDLRIGSAAPALTANME